MIFKKPYGFLIKYFKLIHLILTGLYIYLAYKVNSILKFYNLFIEKSIGKLDAINYITNYYIIAIVLSIIICIIIYALMRYKKKPRLLYLILIAEYLAVAFMIGIAYNGLDTIYIAVLETKTLLLYRDLLRIVIIFQYISIFFVLIRGLGFDIKKFNFVQDLQDLDMDVSDAEEVELTLGGTESAQRKVRRSFREFKYYYLENKNFINVIIMIIVVAVGSMFFVKKEVVDKVYEENEVFSSEDFSFKILNTYVTNKDYENVQVGSTDTAFVIVRMQVAAKGSEKLLNTSKLILEVDNNDYTSNKKYAKNFVDLGSAYREQLISKKQIFLFIYKVNVEDANKKMKIVYAEDKEVNLKPVMLDEISETKKLKLGDKIDLSVTSLGSGYLEIKSYEIKDKFLFPYEYELSGKVYTSNLAITSANNVIMHLVIDSSYPFNFSNFNILKQYASLKYKIDGKEYSSIIFSDKSPGNYKNGLYIALDKDVLVAHEIWLDIKIRNKQFIYTLK